MTLSCHHLLATQFQLLYIIKMPSFPYGDLTREYIDKWIDR